MPDADLRTRAAEANAASFFAIATASEGGRALEEPGVRAIATPAAPERPLFNAAFGLEPGALARAYERLAGFYAEAGVPRWTAFVDPADSESVAALAGNGHELDAEPRLMLAEAGDIADTDAPMELDPAPTPETIAALNDRVYGYPGSFARTLCSLTGLDPLVAVVDSEPVACALSHDARGDCHITLVATVPAHRRQGIASGLIRRLVRRGRDRGCTTTSLVATRAGAPVYERLGYRDLGSVQMWERPAP
ncbi:MAG TPA: GNAT family N-acetyltransferase [Gaiellales bacterium]|nr:GNAT family N-acetyltransferase [Gaiellales bacterium]